MNRKPPLRRHARTVSCAQCARLVEIERDLTTDARKLLHFEAICKCGTIVMLSFAPPSKRGPGAHA
jgi:hypothetical protein